MVDEAQIRQLMLGRLPVQDSNGDYVFPEAVSGALSEAGRRTPLSSRHDQW